MILDVAVFLVHLVSLHLLTFLLHRQSFGFGLLFLQNATFGLQDCLDFDLVRIDVPHFIVEVCLSFCDLLMLFFGLIEVLDDGFVLFLVFFSFFGAWQLFDEQDVNDLSEFILSKLIVD